MTRRQVCRGAIRVYARTRGGNDETILQSVCSYTAGSIGRHHSGPGVCAPSVHTEGREANNGWAVMKATQFYTLEQTQLYRVQLGNLEVSIPRNLAQAADGMVTSVMA